MNKKQHFTSFCVEVQCSLGRPYFNLRHTCFLLFLAIVLDDLKQNPQKALGVGLNVSFIHLQEVETMSCYDCQAVLKMFHSRKPYLSLAQMSTSLRVPRLWWQQGAWWPPFKGFISKPKMLPCPPRTSPISCRRSFAVTRYANTCFYQTPLILAIECSHEVFGSKYCVYSNQLHAFRTA